MLTKLAFTVGIALFLALMVGGVGPAIVPQAAFLAAPVVCANGQMTTESQTYYPEPGRTVVSRTWFCIDDTGTLAQLPTLLPIAVCVGYAFVPAFFLILIFGRTSSETTMAGSPVDAPNVSGTGTAGTLDARLAELGRARDAGLITEEEFDSKRKEILDSL
jgi:hypothetical protein